MPEGHVKHNSGFVNPSGKTLRLNREEVAPGTDDPTAAEVNAQVEAAIAEARESGQATINDGFANWGGQVTMDDASVTGPGATVNIDSPEPEAELRMKQVPHAEHGT